MLMKQRFYQALLLLIALLALPKTAWASQDGDVVLQEQWGRQVITVAANQEITFYDWKGTGSISSTSSNNSRSLTVFKPAVAGQSIQITFESCDVTNDGSSWPGQVWVYSGDPDPESTFTYNETLSASSTLPEGTVLDKLDGTYSNKTYISGTADGSLSVGMLWRFAKACDGWVAKVKCVTLENMTITGAGSNYDGIGGTLATKQNVALANAYVTAEGVMNPDNVTGIYFTMTKNEGVVDATALKLYKGDKQVSASVEADGDNYKFVLNEAPADGTTTFTIKGDILGTAAVGAKVQVDITKVTTAAKTDGVTPFTAGTSVVIENPALVIMSATSQTITMGETPLQFYDEGGKDGGIKANTNGQVTFLSGVAGKKVMVDFTVNQIWHGSLYNQELRIYNGTEVNAANLIKTLQQGETGIVRSTADDGSLTIVLYSNASSTTDADGFEATVSLFTPQPMDFAGITTTVASTETLAAGDAEQDLLTIIVKALNTEPAMQVTKMTFTAGETAALIDKAALYFGTTKVGETVVEGSAFDITLTAPQALVEGDNVFTLKYDISDEALNDQTVKAQAVSVTALVNGSAKTESVSDGSVIGTRTVKNIVLSQASQGTVTKTVNNSIAFETKTTSSYSSYCEAGTDDRINVFVPKHDGMVCQIDFSEFNVQYSSSNYGTKSTFKIYAGQSTSGTLLWELNDNSQESVGPGQIIRSTAADGSLTIVFNPKTSYSYYYKGFKTTVSEYLSKDMEVTAVEATQTTTADASIGATGQELLTVKVVAEGNLNALSLSGMKLNMKGTEANLTKVSVWQNDTKLGEAAADADVTVNFDEAVTLTEGDNTFVVKADVSENAAENQAIDAKVVSVHVGSADVAATAGDPEGSRTLKNQILMTEGDHGTLNLGLGKTVAIYDDGGAEGDGADGVNATVTLAPTGEADCIKLTNNGISFAYTAHLYIYKGSEVNDDNLIVDLTGSSAKFEPIITDAAFDGGKLTIKYVGAGSYTKPNFAITAEGYKKTDVAVTGVTTEDISVSEVLKGQTDVKMLKIMVEAKGELTPATITAFNITGTDGEAVDAYHIYQTGTTTTFSANEAFSDSYEITQSGTYYFWLTYDVKTTAEVGQTATATLTSTVVNGSAIDVTTPATATITVASGKSGTYTVGEGGDYATIQGAIDDFGTLGMEGPVTLKIKAGEYAEKVRIPYIKGMGSVNTLTVESESGQRDVKIYHNNYSTAGYSDDQHKKDYGVVTLYQANYVTLKNLEVTTTDLNYKAVVMIKDESRHATIDNCYLHTDIYASTSGDGPALVGHTIIDEENKNNDYLTVKNCLLEGGKYGVYMGGTSTVALPKEVGGIIEGNTFKNNGRFMLYSYDELGAKIRNNTFIIDNADVKMSNGVIDINVRDEYAETTEITGNIFNLNSSNTLAAIYVRQMEATTDAPAIIANNVVNLASANASCSALKFSGGKIKNTNIAHNTLRMTGTNGGATFWPSSALSDGYGNVNVVNNIIQNETSGYAVNLYNDGNLGTEKFNFQNNVMYTAGETFFRAASSTTGDFATFVEKTGATGCINKQVTFYEGTCEPNGTLDGDLLTAQSLSYVTTDIIGKARPATGISIGAYEYDATAVAPTMAEGYPKVSGITHEGAVISLKSDVAATAYVMTCLTADIEDEVTAEEIITDGKTVSLQANSEATVTITERAPENEYTVYIVMKSVKGLTSQVYSTTFTTQELPTNAPTIDLSADGNTLTLLLAEGKAPYQLTWKQADGTVLKEETLTELPSEPLTLAVTPAVTTDYIVILKDKQAREATASVRIVAGEVGLMADFETHYPLTDDGYWCGPGLVHAIGDNWGEDELQGTFTSGGFSFTNNYTPEYKSWTGFSVSNSTSTEFESYVLGQYHNAVGGGYGSETFAISFDNTMVEVLGTADGTQLRGFYITNSAYNVDYYENGDTFNEGVTGGDGQPVAKGEGFRTGDWCYVHIEGFDKDDHQTNEIDVYLADYRSANDDEHFYLKDWQWVDLSSLGAVKKVKFSVQGSRGNTWGQVVPLYFCLDNFNGFAPLAGDVNGDGEVNVTDVSLTRSFILGNTPATFIKKQADMNGDGEVNVTDLSKIKNIILGNNE